MRILIVSHGALRVEAGAAQIALNLADALRELAHEVVVWSSVEGLGTTAWWRARSAMRHALDARVSGVAPFDIVDAPATQLTATLRRAGRHVVARSTQPIFTYLASEFRRPGSLRAAAHEALASRERLAWASHAVAGWHRATRILSLGLLEDRWMRRHFPFWAGKLRHHVIAPSRAEQRELAALRAARHPGPGPGRRFLWIGRWAPHKGTQDLLRFFAAWSREHPADRLTIAGCGAAATADVADAGLSHGAVGVVPAFDRPGLMALLRDHDAGLMTSRVEGWGLSLNEMLESGLPVFATPTGGVPDLERHFPGLLGRFPPPADWRAPTSWPSPSEDYARRFNWGQIARDYLDAVVGEA